MSVDCLLNKTIILSFKFSEYILQIEHKHINDIGSFAIFCLRAFRDNYSNNQISQITNINSDVIERQLKFLMEKSYIDNNYNLDINGKDILQAYDFIEKNNSAEKLIYFDHYIRNSKNKKINTEHSIIQNRDKKASFLNESTGVQLLGLINTYKIKSIFDEIVETDKAKLASYLSSIFFEDTDLIKKNIDEFIFKIIPTNKQTFFNNTIDIANIKSLLSNNDGTILFAIPVKEYKSSISSINSVDENETENSKKWFMDNKNYLNFAISLFDNGEVDTDIMIETREHHKVCLLPKLFDASNYSAKNITIPLSFFYNVSLDKSCKETLFLQKMTEENFNKLIED